MFSGIITSAWKRPAPHYQCGISKLECNTQKQSTDRNIARLSREVGQYLWSVCQPRYVRKLAKSEQKQTYPDKPQPRKSWWTAESQQQEADNTVDVAQQ